MYKQDLYLQNDDMTRESSLPQISINHNKSVDFSQLPVNKRNDNFSKVHNLQHVP